MTFYEVIQIIGKVIEFAGIGTIVIGAVAAAILAVVRLVTRSGPIYFPFRRLLGRSILLGLELLVAADIIRTVALTPTLENVVVLGGIVLIRTFLSFSLELEITGHWPWQNTRSTASEPAGAVPSTPPSAF